MMAPEWVPNVCLTDERERSVAFLATLVVRATPDSNRVYAVSHWNDNLSHDAMNPVIDCWLNQYKLITILRRIRISTKKPATQLVLHSN
ncbi:hypothetical protein BLOT_003210 [Blomia tropicalis]|nr:hypothetical protein BLOT_003210 [Blomia tropicalis]